MSNSVAGRRRSEAGDGTEGQGSDRGEGRTDGCARRARAQTVGRRRTNGKGSDRGGGARMAVHVRQGVQSAGHARPAGAEAI